MEVEGCGSFTHLQSNWSDLVTTLIEWVWNVEGDGVSLTCARWESPPLLGGGECSESLSKMSRIEYITTTLWSDIGNDGTKQIA